MRNTAVSLAVILFFVGSQRASQEDVPGFVYEDEKRVAWNQLKKGNLYRLLNGVEVMAYRPGPGCSQVGSDVRPCGEDYQG